MVSLLDLLTPVPTLRRAGWAADLCPICHRVTIFEVLRHGKTIGHIGKGWLYRCEARCRGCGWTKVVKPDEYAALHDRPEGVIPEVLELPGHLLRALELELARKKRALTPDERREAVELVFEAADTFSETEKSSQAGALARSSRVRYVLLPLLIFALGIVLLLSGWVPREAVSPVLLGLAALPVASCLVGWISYPYRFARFVLRPLIVRGLLPLGATAAEIEVAARRRRWNVHWAAYRGLAKDAT
ncbi:MAG: hypothetical protein ACHQ1G_06130 [Planctomycetota bacterium]